MSHTQGKLHFTEERHSKSKHSNDWVPSHHLRADSNDFPIAELSGYSGTEREANARRLAACWNACEAISTESLETELSTVTAWSRTAKQLIATMTQRDDLLEALRSCEPPHPACGETVGDCVNAGKCGCSLGAAINKAEGKS